MEILTVITIVGILAAIVIPVVGAMRGTARTGKCVSNLRQVGAAFAMYGQEHDQCLPPPLAADGTAWFVALQAYVGSRTEAPPTSYAQLNPVFACPEWQLNRDAWGFPPADQPPTDPGYAMCASLNGTPNPAKGVPLTQVAMPSQTVLVLENHPWPEAESRPYFTGSAEEVADLAAPAHLEAGLGRHRGNANYLFVDGHVKQLTPAAATALLTRE